MSIRLVPDVGAPLAVVAVDLITETYAPQANEITAYVLAAGSYVAAGMNKGGDFVKNVGIASFPWAAKKIYHLIAVSGNGQAKSPGNACLYRTAPKSLLVSQGELISRNWITH